ncbi:high-affinity nickel-transporter [Desulfurispirillum indicum S5]|uniref:Nickel/cobalt efflux system n=1 Tax=Desulfurispirillum indicum (strain ATCC BAA-1389 / DSM 22839 / S5) TaxID=653733 RepID=E6W3A6_DESIS|nr:DUF1007 family protein [Desulfurispirillum indicum]ADU66860.1 high-affinity nickel-transporter [Desulfurispirillum indicum S5]
MKTPLRFIILLLSVVMLSQPQLARACALCSAFDGVVFPRFHLEMDDDVLQAIQVTWRFSPSFTEVLRHLSSEASDANQARQRLLHAFEADIVPYEYLTRITINSQPFPVRAVENSHFTFEGDVSAYHFTIPIHMPVSGELSLELEFFDPRRFLGFFFRPEGLSHTIPENYGVEHNLNSYPHTLVLRIAPGIASTETEVAVTRDDSPAGWYDRMLDSLRQTLRMASETIQSHMRAIRDEGSVAAALSLIIFSFFYGLLHAAGPGHGKSLVASYFLAGHHNYAKAASMALFIGIVHVFSAFIFTFFLLHLLNMLLTTALHQTTNLLTPVSGAIIILIAAHLAYTRLRARWKVRQQNSSGYPQPHHGLHQGHACGCSSCSGGGRTSDAMLVISAGIVPCPGTITIFLFALSMGLYTIGFLAAAAMSLGMGIIIFAAAALSIIARNVLSHAFQPLATFVEYTSIICIALLGVLLILSSMG